MTKKLQNVFKLGSKVTAYIPATIHDKEIDNTEYVNTMATTFSELFGGATSTQALGYWKSQEAGLIKEHTTLVFAYCTTEQLESGIDKVIEEMEIIKTVLQQEAMALEINGELYFI